MYMDLIGDMMITYSDDDHYSNYKSTGNGCNDKEGDHDIEIDHIDSSSFLPSFFIFHLLLIPTSISSILFFLTSDCINWSPDIMM